MDNSIGLAQNPEAPPEPRIIAYCCECGGEIYDGDFYGNDGKTRIHTDCIDDLWDRLSNAQKLNHFGYSTTNRE